jgi:hypothetical protein
LLPRRLLNDGRIEKGKVDGRVRRSTVSCTM